MAIVVIDGHGRPSQLSREFSKTLDTILAGAFGDSAKVTSLTKTGYQPTLVDITESNDEDAS